MLGRELQRRMTFYFGVRILHFLVHVHMYRREPSRRAWAKLGRGLHRAVIWDGIFEQLLDHSSGIPTVDRQPLYILYDDFLCYAPDITEAIIMNTTVLSAPVFPLLPGRLHFESSLGA